MFGLTGSQTAIWNDEAVDATTVLVKYTYAGDANLDGRIDVDDYFQIDSNYNKPASTLGYFKGDFDYNGIINGDDYFILDSNYPAQGMPFGSATIAKSVVAVPPSETAISAKVSVSSGFAPSVVAARTIFSHAKDDVDDSGIIDGNYTGR